MELSHAIARLIPAAVWLGILWSAESYVAVPRARRLRHGAANLAMAAINGLLLFFTVGSMSVYICEHAEHRWFGWASPLVAFLGLDLFCYLWHRANHRVRWLWRFHRVHHADSAMDVTTAGRFHVGELGMAALVRLPLLYGLGVSTSLLLTYETTLLAVSMFHHANVRLGPWDAVLQTLLVTPGMHSIHHSRDPGHFDRNFSSVLSIWDRLFGTFHTTTAAIEHGLDGIHEAQAICVRSMLSAPFTCPDDEAG